MLKPFGLNHPEYNLLMMLYGTPGGVLNPSQLADAAGEKSANITRLTNRLCEQGLIARTASAEDRRKIALTLTPEGEALIERLLPACARCSTASTHHQTTTSRRSSSACSRKCWQGWATDERRRCHVRPRRPARLGRRCRSWRALLGEDWQPGCSCCARCWRSSLTGWLAMRFALPQPSTAMLTTHHRRQPPVRHGAGQELLPRHRHARRRAGGMLIVALFPQQRALFLLAMALWIGVCAGGATLHRNFKSYAFVLGGYTAAIVAMPVIGNPPAVFDSAVARISEVLLGLLVSGVISDTVFPSRMRDVLRQAARAQFAHFLGFVQRSTGGAIRRAMRWMRAHLRFVRDAVTLEDLRSSVIFEDADARARSGHMQLFNQRFMAASTSFQSVHHLINRLSAHGVVRAARALVALYAPIGRALDAPVEAGERAAHPAAAPAAARAQMARAGRAPACARCTSMQDRRDFDTGATLLLRFADELHGYVDAAVRTAGAADHRQPARARALPRAATTGSAPRIATMRTTLTMLALGVFWIASAWPFGSSAMLLATIFAGLFATTPHPPASPGMVTFGYVVGMAAAFVCDLLRADPHGRLRPDGRRHCAVPDARAW